MSNELENVPVNIRYYREKAGYKQYQAAEKAGISGTYWNHIENGRTPPLPVLLSMADVLGITLTQLFEERQP